MRLRFLLFVALASLVAHSLTPSGAYAEDAAEAISDEQRSEAIAQDALQRLKRAKLEEKANAEKSEETSNTESTASSVTKKSIYFFALLMIGFSIFKKFTLKQTRQEEKEYIDVVSRKALSSRSSLFIVQVEQQKLLLSQNGDDVRFLPQLSSPSQLPAEVFINAAEENTPLPRKVMA